MSIFSDFLIKSTSPLQPQEMVYTIDSQYNVIQQTPIRNQNNNKQFESSTSLDFSDLGDDNDCHLQQYNFIEGDSAIDLITGLNEIFQNSKLKDKENANPNKIVDKQQQQNYKSRSPDNIKSTEKVYKKQFQNLNLNLNNELQPLSINKNNFIYQEGKILVKKQMVAQFKQKGIQKQKENISKLVLKVISEPDQSYGKLINNPQFIQKNSIKTRFLIRSQNEKYEIQKSRNDSKEESTAISKDNSQNQTSPLKSEQNNISRKIMIQNKQRKCSIKIKRKELNQQFIPYSLQQFQASQPDKLKIKQEQIQQKSLSTSPLTKLSYHLRTPTFTRLQQNIQNEYSSQGNSQNMLQQSESSISTNKKKSFLQSSQARITLMKQLTNSSLKQLNGIEDQVYAEELSEQTVVSPNFKADKNSDFNERKNQSFNSPHRISEANKKIKKTKIQRIDIEGGRFHTQNNNNNNMSQWENEQKPKRDLGTLSFLKRCSVIKGWNQEICN